MELTELAARILLLKNVWCVDLADVQKYDELEYLLLGLVCAVPCWALPLVIVGQVCLPISKHAFDADVLSLGKISKPSSREVLGAF